MAVIVIIIHLLNIISIIRHDFPCFCVDLQVLMSCVRKVAGKLADVGLFMADVWANWGRTFEPCLANSPHPVTQSGFPCTWRGWGYYNNPNNTRLGQNFFGLLLFCLIFTEWKIPAITFPSIGLAKKGMRLPERKCLKLNVGNGIQGSPDIIMFPALSRGFHQPERHQ